MDVCIPAQRRHPHSLEGHAIELALNTCTYRLISINLNGVIQGLPWWFSG